MLHLLIRIISVVIFVVGATVLQAQTIRLNNPSFEDEPAHSTTPQGWRDCGKPGETPPDIQPNAIFRVFTKAQKGSTYLGLVTRDTDTWEAVGQLLETSLVGGECYDFSIYLSRSGSYLSRRRVDTAQTQFTQPIRLRIWAGNNYCDKRELLAETDVIEHTKWKKYDFKFKPRREYNFIMLEAFYMTPTLVAYNGNLLLDNCSAITIASCGDDEPAIAQVNPKPRNENVAPTPEEKRQERKEEKRKERKEEKERNDSRKEVPETEPEPIAKIDLPEEEKPVEKEVEIVEEAKKEEEEKAPPAEPKEAEEKPKPPKVTAIEKLDENDIEEGQIIRVNKLNFPANSSIITKSTYEVLDKIYDFLSRNAYIVIEIGGHTNNVPDDAYCNKLSKERSESVATYLIEKGIDPKRITAKGYGKTQPIATNETLAGRRQNQRVEIKVISIGK